jgi:hypothetical protein
VAQSLSIALPSRRCSAAVSVVVLRGSTGIAPAGKCCLVGNGLVNIDSPIAGPFWVFIVLVISTWVAWVPKTVCVCVHARIRFGKYGRNLDSVEFFSKNVNLPHFSCVKRNLSVTYYSKIYSKMSQTRKSIVARNIFHATQM